MNVNKQYFLIVQMFLFPAFLIFVPGCDKKPKKAITNEGKKRLALQQAETFGLSDLINELQVAIANNPEDMDLKFRLAEAYMNDDRYTESAEVFRLIAIMNPSDERVEYAKYNEILSRFKQACTIDVNCDSTDLTETLKLCGLYLDNRIMSLYNEDVDRIREKCEDKLLDKTISTFNFYLRTDKIEAARAILEKIKTKFLAQNESIKPKVLYLECKLAKHGKNKEVIETNLSYLMDEFPDSEYTKMASSLSNHPLLVSQAAVLVGA
jgi:outer membrane protein assembly factor BamD (BamD/ComL family)